MHDSVKRFLGKKPLPKRYFPAESFLNSFPARILKFGTTAMASKQMGIVRKWLECSCVYPGSDYNMGPFTNFPHDWQGTVPKANYRMSGGLCKLARLSAPFWCLGMLNWPTASVKAGQRKCCLLVYRSIHLRYHLWSAFLCMHLSVHRCIHQSICPSVHPFIHPLIHSSTYPFIHLSIDPSIHTSFHPSSHLSICQSIHQGTHGPIPSIDYRSLHL